MTNSNALTLRVGGQIYGGWMAVNIRTGIQQLAGSYEIGITERWPEQHTDWAIPPGEFCEVLIGDDTVICGYVDSVSTSYDAGSHEIKVTGRDRAGDLVDCSAPSRAFSGLTFTQIAEILCKPHEIAVYDETALGKKLTVKQKKSGKKGSPPKKPRVGGKVPKQASQNGESVFRTLDKLARQEGVLLVSDGEGGILVTRAGLGGECETHLEFGVNILRASYEESFVELYSEITVKGQASAAGAKKYGVSQASPKGKVSRAIVAKSGHSQIDRYRPLIIVAESQAGAKRCQQRAEWEASNREAKSRKVTVTVQGWREKPEGDLWAINRMVRVRCPWMRMDEWWLIAGVTYRLDDGGTVSELQLVDERAFDLLPEIPPAGNKSSGGKYRVASKK
jgi:prophage tail gpP-like protein